MKFSEWKPINEGEDGYWKMQMDSNFSHKEITQINDFVEEIKQKFPTLTEEEVFFEIIKLSEDIYWKRLTESITRFEASNE